MKPRHLKRLETAFGARRLILYCLIAVLSVLVCSSIHKFLQSDRMGAAAERGDLDTIRDLIKEGVNPKGTGMHAMTPLMRAAKGAQLEACRLLIRNGSDVNEHNDSGSVLMWAIDSESKDIVELLIENRVDLDWESVTGEGALSFAKEKKATDIIDILTREHGNSPR